MSGRGMRAPGPQVGRRFRLVPVMTAGRRPRPLRVQERIRGKIRTDDRGWPGGTRPGLYGLSVRFATAFCPGRQRALLRPKVRISLTASWGSMSRASTRSVVK